MKIRYEVSFWDGSGVIGFDRMPFDEVDAMIAIRHPAIPLVMRTVVEAGQDAREAVEEASEGTIMLYSHDVGVRMMQQPGDTFALKEKTRRWYITGKAMEEA